MQLDPKLTGLMNEKITEYLKKVREEEEFLISGWLSFCESPIEQRLGLELAYAEVESVYKPRPFTLLYDDKDIDIDELEKYAPLHNKTREIHNNQLYLLYNQARILDYRVDFLILYRWKYGSDEIKKIVIECDGQDFHDRTKEQAARDRRRDNDLQLLGFDVLRFTGSQIYKDARGCVSTVMRHIHIESDDIRGLLGGRISDRLRR
jgi:very-short-patch-repair endonuclease